MAAGSSRHGPQTPWPRWCPEPAGPPPLDPQASTLLWGSRPAHTPEKRRKRCKSKGLSTELLRSSLIRWHGWTHLQRFQQQSRGEEGWESWYQPHEDYRSGQEATVESDDGQAGSEQHSHQGVDHTHCPGREQTAGLSSSDTWDSARGISNTQHTSSPHEI